MQPYFRGCKRHKLQSRLVARGFESFSVKTVESARLDAFEAHRLRGFERAGEVLFALVAHGIRLERKARRGEGAC